MRHSSVMFEVDLVIYFEIYYEVDNKFSFSF